MNAAQASDLYFGHPPDAFASMHALSQAAHSANDLDLSHDRGDHRN
jgi:hypothetical protein